MLKNLSIMCLKKQANGPAWQLLPLPIFHFLGKKNSFFIIKISKNSEISLPFWTIKNSVTFMALMHPSRTQPAFLWKDHLRALVFLLRLLSSFSPSVPSVAFEIFEHFTPSLSYNFLLIFLNLILHVVFFSDFISFLLCLTSNSFMFSFNFWSSIIFWPATFNMVQLVSKM